MKTIKAQYLKTGNFYIGYFTSDDLHQINQAENEEKEYQIEEMPTHFNDCYFVQIKADTLIKKHSINKSFNAGTIFFLRKKDSETAHHFLATSLLDLKTDQLQSAGELKIEGKKLVSWNLKSGTYWDKLDSSNENVIKSVGLPFSRFEKISHFKEQIPSENNLTHYGLFSASIDENLLFTDTSKLKISRSCTLL